MESSHHKQMFSQEFHRVLSSDHSFSSHSSMICQRSQHQTLDYLQMMDFCTEIDSETDSIELKKDLDALQEWERTWQMHNHPEKCQVIHICTNKRFRKHPTYKLHGHTLESVDGAKYLGVTLMEDLSWKPHVDNTAVQSI